MATSGNLYDLRKRRFFGEVMQEAEIKREKAWAHLHKSSKELLGTFESEGLVVSINGGGEDMPMNHPHAEDAKKLAATIVELGGIVLNGGRKKGIMQASSKGGGQNVIGVLYPEIDEKKQRMKHEYAMVNSPSQRIEILATCPPIMVIFQGGIGTLQQLLRAVVHLHDHQYHPEQLPQMVFISNYWTPMLQTMVNMRALPAQYMENVQFFASADEVIAQLPKA
ncbi:MAG: LOG family protein [Patescibacteria group bacterium]|jgi:predicted Rossmann-fold nucleotide-binding protein